jgi:hypothetical protein
MYDTNAPKMAIVPEHKRGGFAARNKVYSGLLPQNRWTKGNTCGTPLYVSKIRDEGNDGHPTGINLVSEQYIHALS